MPSRLVAVRTPLLSTLCSLVSVGPSLVGHVKFDASVLLTRAFLAILGATNPLASAPGTIRGDYAIDVGRNVCHGSDSVENANKEIALWFKEEDLVSWKSAQFDWIYEKA